MTDNKLHEMLETIQGQGTRSFNSNDAQSIIHYVLTADPEEVYNFYNENIELCEQENVHYDDEVVYSAVVTATSAEEANKLYEFIDLYIDKGGKNLNLLAKATNGRSVPVQNAMVQSACVIDNIFESGQRQIVTSVSYCLYQLEIELIGSLVKDEIVDAIIADLSIVPGLDVAAALVVAGEDFYDAIKLAKDFNDCTAKNWS